MAGMVKHAAMGTKIRSMEGKMLKKGDYDALLKMTSVSAVAHYLKEFESLSLMLSGINDKETHRGDLEKRLGTQMILEFKKLYNFADSGTKKFLSIYFMQFELGLLKRVARAISEGGRENFSEDSDEFLKKHLHFDLSEAYSLSGIKELTEYISTIKCFKVLASMLKAKEKYDVFTFEMTLDVYFYNLVSKSLKHIADKEEKEIFLKYFGTKVDLLNLKWIYRCKVNFDTDTDTIISYIIPFYHKIGKKDVANLAAAKKDEFLLLIRDTYYGKIFENSDFDYESTVFLKNFYKKLKANYPYSTTAILCYLQLRRIEAGNIISVIEGIRYSLTDEETKKFLVI